jgi:hypothetical protein
MKQKFVHLEAKQVFSLWSEISKANEAKIKWNGTRVETKIFFSVFSRKFLKFIFAFRQKIIQNIRKFSRKIDSKIFAKTKIEVKIFENENFRENENYYEHLRKNFTFWYNHILTRLVHNFLQKFSRKLKFSKTNFCKNENFWETKFGEIFAFRENGKNSFRFTINRTEAFNN